MCRVPHAFFQLSDVQYGGATVFPHAGVRVRVVKASYRVYSHVIANNVLLGDCRLYGNNFDVGLCLINDMLVTFSDKQMKLKNDSRYTL